MSPSAQPYGEASEWATSAFATTSAKLPRRCNSVAHNNSHVRNPAGRTTRAEDASNPTTCSPHARASPGANDDLSSIATMSDKHRSPSTNRAPRHRTRKVHGEAINGKLALRHVRRIEGLTVWGSWRLRIDPPSRRSPSGSFSPRLRRAVGRSRQEIFLAFHRNRRTRKAAMPGRSSLQVKPSGCQQPIDPEQACGCQNPIAAGQDASFLMLPTQ